MNRHAKRRQVSMGIAYLKEVVADVLQDVQDKSEPGLAVAIVAERAGLPTGDPDRNVLCRYILESLANDDVAVNDQPGQGADRWRLTS